jgi:hypothetical protein
MKITIKLFAFLILVLSVNACTQTETKETIKDVVEATVCPVDEIPSGTATPMLTNAKAYIDEVNSTLEPGAIKIPYGAKIPVCEMKEILTKLGDTPDVWAMMAMEDDELTIIFQGKDQATDSYVYYDFTKPCPDKCPESITF